MLCILSVCNLNAQNFEKHISRLCADSLIGRMPGTVGEQRAITYIESQLAQQFNSEHQLFYYTDHNNNKCRGINLLCKNENKTKSDSVILLLAHHDHLGHGTHKSMEIVSSKRQKIHPGADDNASGVSMVLELGKWYANLELPNYRMILLFTSAHEQGLHGAENFVKSIDIESFKLKAIFNFDMVGRLDKIARSLNISDNQKDIEYYQSLSSELQFIKGDIIQFTDLRHFMDYPIHLVNFTTGIHEDYHRISDTPEKINYKGMIDIFEFVKKVLINIA